LTFTVTATAKGQVVPDPGVTPTLTPNLGTATIAADGATGTYTAPMTAGTVELGAQDSHGNVAPPQTITIAFPVPDAIAISFP